MAASPQSRLFLTAAEFVQNVFSHRLAAHQPHHWPVVDSRLAVVTSLLIPYKANCLHGVRPEVYQWNPCLRTGLLILPILGSLRWCWISSLDSIFSVKKNNGPSLIPVDSRDGHAVALDGCPARDGSVDETVF